MMKSFVSSLAVLILSCGVALGCTEHRTIPIPTPGSDKPGEKEKEEEKPPVALENDATRRTMEMGLGWNLGNQLDAYEEDPNSSRYLIPDETVWGNPKVTRQAIEKVRAAGFTTIRVPVTWLGKIGPAPTYTIDAGWMERVAEVIGYAHDAGFRNVILDTHHDEDHDDGHWQDLKGASRDPALNAQIKKEITAVWTQIANRLKDCGDWLMFEGFNELNDGGWGYSKEFKADPTRQCNVLNEWLQVFVDAVRATGGNNATRWLGISPYCANPIFAKYLVMPSDSAKKLMLSVHFYDPSSYTIGDEYYTDWGHTGRSGHKAKSGDEDYVKEVFGMLYDTYIAKNVPVYIGEFGCSRRDKKDGRAWRFNLYYLEYVAKAARTYCLPAVLWDCGGRGVPGPEHHFYFRHDTGEYYPDAKEAIDAILKGWFSDDAGYTLQTVYNSAPVF